MGNFKIKKNRGIMSTFGKKKKKPVPDTPKAVPKNQVDDSDDEDQDVETIPQEVQRKLAFD
jgi:hypothetical protein